MDKQSLHETAKRPAISPQILLICITLFQPSS